MARETNSLQIIRFDGRDCFMEVMNTGFEIGKVYMNFISYDQNKKAGERYTQKIPIYMDIDKFLVLSADIMSGKIHGLAEKEKAKGNKYPDKIFDDMGGTPAETLAQRGKAREDGGSESRVLKILPGAKLPFIFQAELGKGEKNEKGLIVPRYGGKPEQKVMIPMQGDDLKRFALVVKTHIDAYITAKYTNEGSEKIVKDLKETSAKLEGLLKKFDNQK
ncbi:hypothetical protein [Bacillus thuringiensis]|uniref:hypothetical protein n=1 Tax=Bacillus thuringiensis TaxID=1428 RepID=UPI00119FE607|nr:hypothetical protein [Bacillus thuringiensis]